MMFPVHAPGWWSGVRPIPLVEAGEPLFGFTVLDPFGSAIVDGPKRIENRSKPPPERLCGRAFWIAVHSGARLYPDLERVDFTSTSLLHRDPQTGEKHPPLWPACPPFSTFRQRVILGAARVVGATIDHELHRFHAVPAVDRDRWSMRGQWHWILDPTVIRLPEAFPWEKGDLGLWAPKGDHPNATAFLRLRDALRAAMADSSCHRRAS